jgi:DNA processing protein
MTELNDRESLIILSTLCEPGNADLAAALATHGPSGTLRMLRRPHPSTPLQRAVAARLGNEDLTERLGHVLAVTRACGARIITTADEEWPAALGDLEGMLDEADPNTRPPVCLWLRGKLELAPAMERSVSIVGARDCTSYGRQVATEFGYGLAQRGWTVVSGGAYGIDEAAHRGALAGGGATVAVLACGVDRPYPACNSTLFDRICETGLLLSEWPPGAIPQRHRFLVRNRVIAALTPATVVVEAALRSGARQTARRAWELDRTVMVVPGPVTSKASAGVHQLARGPGEVRIVTRPEEVIEDLGRLGEDLAPALRGHDHDRDALEPVAAKVLDAVPRRTTAASAQIAAQAGLTPLEVRRILPLLLMRGFVTGSDDAYRLTS